MSIKIRDLIEFEEVEEVIKLHAEREDIVRSYVISESLQRNLLYMLELLSGATHKSFNIIGNYGTGKSHFLSFVAAILEHPDKRREIVDGPVRQAATKLDRKYLVVKFELGATQVPLRHVFFDQVQRQLLDHYDIEIAPVDLDRDYDNVAKMGEVVAAVKATDPEAGLMVIVDEISDSLKQKSPEVMTYDLNFLRELGQISQSLDFVYIGAMQEHVFTNPKYVQQAANIARVAERFVDVTITKEDVARVLSERVLRKSPEQRLRLQGLLGDHKTYFTNLAEQLPHYVDTFPIHPYVIEMFEQLPYFESRGIIGFAVDNVKPILDEEAPRFITYDRIFDLIDATHEIRNLPEVGKVVTVVHTLTSKVDVLPERVRDDARRVIKALAVLKLLERGTINGATPQELANTLFIIPPGKLLVDPDMARDNIERIFKNIRDVTFGQYISYENGYYFLNLEKLVDYDAMIDQRIASWGEGKAEVARAFGEIVTARLSLDETKSLIAGKRVFADSAPWPERSSYREGILVIGDPNDGAQLTSGDFRAVVQGPIVGGAAQERQNELRLVVAFDDAMIAQLRRKAAADALAADGHHRKVFTDLAKKAAETFNALYLAKLLAEGVAWLGGSMTPLTELHTTRPLQTVADVLDFVKGELLGPVFSKKYPQYPRFKTRLTAANVESEMSRAIAAQDKGATYGFDLNTRSYLEALGAAGRDGQFSSRNSAACRLITDEVAQNDKAGKVTPLDDVLKIMSAVPWGIQRPIALFLVAALHVNGELVLVRSGGKRVHAGAPESNLKDGLALFDEVRYLERDRDIDTDRVGQIFSLLGLAKGLVVDRDQRAEGVKQLRETASGLTTRLQDVADGFTRARSEPLTEVPWVSLEALNAGLEPFRTQVRAWREVTKVTDLGKLPQTDDDLTTAASGLTTLAQLHNFLSDYHEFIKPGVTYMQQAAKAFDSLRAYATPAGQRTLDDLLRILNDSRELLANQRALLTDDMRRPLKGKIDQFRDKYKPLYYQLHRQHVGDDAPWAEVDRLRTSDRYQSLNRLKTLPFFSSAEFDQIGLIAQRLQRRRCQSFNVDVLEREPVCPYCRFPETGERIDLPAEVTRLQTSLEALWEKWQSQAVTEAERLLAEKVGVKQTRADLLPEADRKRVKDLVRRRILPEAVDEALVRSLYELAAGLEAVTLDLNNFAAQLLAERSVLTADELERAWETYVNNLLHGRDRDRVRIQVRVGETAHDEENPNV
jgi:hypothetical protein